MKYSIYILVSISLASLVLLRAFCLRPNFWSTSILLSQSNGSLLVLTNLALIWTGGTVYLLQRLFYGRLRPIEVEQLYEKGWVAVTETALALTIFREDVGARFFIMFLSLMIGKIWAWIGEGRIEFMEQQPSSSRLPAIRLAASLSVSLAFDAIMLSYCLDTLAREPKPGMWVMYAFEYVILLVQSTSLFLRFCLNIAEFAIVHRQTQSRLQARREELQRERAAEREREPTDEPSSPDSTPDDIDEMDIDVPGWEDKGRWMFYLDLMTDFIKSMVYCGFFMVLLFFHGLPLHIMRDLYITVRSFLKRITDFVQYRNATKDMNARYPDATHAELQADNTCIICREEMMAWEDPAVGNEQQANRRPDERQRPKRLPCGHILHFGCLRSWLERQRVCPTCRRSVLTPNTPTPVTTNQANGGIQPPNDDAQQGRVPEQQPGQNNAQALPGGGQRPNQFRVVNVGPLRIAFGRTPGPGGVQGLLQQMANRQHQADNPNTQTNTPLRGQDNVQASTPLLIQQQIMQLQAQVLQLMQRLQGEHLQLDVLERLVAELVRLQSDPVQMASNVSMTQAENLTSPGSWQLPQAFQLPIGQHALVAGSTGLPPGMVLPAGYSLQRLHAVDQRLPQSTSAEAFSVLNDQRALQHGSTRETIASDVSNPTLIPEPSDRARDEGHRQRNSRPASVEDA